MSDVLKALLNILVAFVGMAVPALIVVGVILLIRRHRDPDQRALVLKRTGMWIMGGLALFFGVFAIGETLSDPGGWKAVGMISAWLGPLAVLGLIGWFRPDWGLPLLTAVATGVIALEAWAAFDPSVRRLEDRVGPFTLITLLAAAIAIAALAHSRPRAAGVLLILTGVGPLLFSIIGTVGIGPGPILYVIFGTPVSLAGVLFLVSAQTTFRIHPRSGGVKLA